MFTRIQANGYKSLLSVDQRALSRVPQRFLGSILALKVDAPAERARDRFETDDVATRPDRDQILVVDGGHGARHAVVLFHDDRVRVPPDLLAVRQ